MSRFGVWIRTRRGKRRLKPSWAERTKGWLRYDRAKGVEAQAAKRYGADNVKVRKRPEPEVKYPTATHYSPHFTKVELDCKCGCSTPEHVQVELVRLCRVMLEPLRDALGGYAVPIVSGYRCPTYNAQVGGASNSQHMYGKAVDFDMKRLNGRGISQDRMVYELKRLTPVNGIGEYPGGAVHGDVRQPPRAFWTHV